MAKQELITGEQFDEKLGGTLKQWLDRPDIAETLRESTAGWMELSRFKTQLLLDIQNEKIAHCRPASKLAAVVKCATLQLLPSLNQVALVPRKVWVEENGRKKCVGEDVTVVIQWQGYQALMMRAPGVIDVRAVLVHVNDKYKYDPVTEAMLLHDLDPLDPKRTFKSIQDVKGGYCVITFGDGRPKRWHYVTHETIAAAMGCAETKNVWNKWPAEMSLKTIFRNTYNRRVVAMDPMLSQRIERLIHHDDEQLGNDPNRRTFDVNSESLVSYDPETHRKLPQVSRAEQLAERYAPPPEDDEPQEHGSNVVDVTDQQTVATGEPERDTVEDKPAGDEPPADKAKPSKEYLALKAQIEKARTSSDLDKIMDDVDANVAREEITGLEHEKLVQMLRMKHSEV